MLKSNLIRSIEFGTTVARRLKRALITSNENYVGLEMKNLNGAILTRDDAIHGQEVKRHLKNIQTQFKLRGTASLLKLSKQPLLISFSLVFASLNTKCLLTSL